MTRTHATGRDLIAEKGSGVVGEGSGASDIVDEADGCFFLKVNVQDERRKMGKKEGGRWIKAIAAEVRNSCDSATFELLSLTLSSL